jgi:hypothetical protein
LCLIMRLPRIPFMHTFKYLRSWKMWQAIPLVMRNWACPLCSDVNPWKQWHHQHVAAAFQD